MSFKNTKHLQNVYLASVPEPKIISDVISGSVNEASGSDKSIWVYDRNTGELLASTMVDRDTRNWSVAVDPNHPDESLLVVCRDEGGEYNADIYDRVSLCSREVEVSGISNVLNWGEKDLARCTAVPKKVSDYYQGNVKNYKGNISKVVEDNGSLKFVDSSGTEITNSALEDVVVLNGESVIKNNTNKNGYILSWKRDIFNDGSEVGKLEYRNGNWYDYYTGNRLEHNTSVSEDDKFGDVTVGKFGEPAILLSTISTYPTEYRNQRGPKINLNVGTTEEVSVSFLYYNSEAINNKSSISGNTAYIRFMTLAWPIQNNTQLRSIQSAFQPHGTSSSSLTDVEPNSVIIGFNSSNGVRTVITNELNGGVPFTWHGVWHHILFNITKTSMTLYIDGNLISTYSHASSDITELVSMGLGACDYINGSSREYFKNGVYSNIRVFNRLIQQEEIQTLIDDTPVVDCSVETINTVECDNGLISLAGGVAYKPLYDVFPYSEVSNNGILTCVYATTTPDVIKKDSNYIPVLCDNYVILNGNANVTRVALGTRPDTAHTGELGFDLNDIEVYMKLRIRQKETGSATSFPLIIGGTQSALLIYIYDSKQMQFIWNKSKSGYNNVPVSPNISSFYDRWIEIKWTQTQVSVYYEGESIPFFTRSYTENIKNTSLGQVAVGTMRCRTSYESRYGDVYTFSGDVSDVVIYKKGTMDTNDPVIYKEYRFGYKRNGLAGLDILPGYNLTPIPNVDGTGIAFSGRCNDSGKDSKAALHLKDSLKSVMDASKGFSLCTYAYLDPSYINSNLQYDNVYLFMSEGQTGLKVHYMGLRHHVYWYVFDGKSTKTVRGVNKNAIIDRWNHYGYTGSYDSVSKLLRYKTYSDGVNVDTQSYYNEFSFTNPSPPNIVIHWEGTNWDNKAAYNNGFDKVNLYDKALPPSCWRNLSQNYSGKVCSNKMQVAVLTENTSAPIYKGIPITKITIDGNDNGQILSFAVAQGAEDYFIYSGSWKKIVTTEGDNYKYRDGNTWVTANDKFDALEKAMDIQDNRMSLAEINSLTPSQIAEFYDQSIGSIDIAVGMKSDGSISPYIDGITFNNEKVWLSHVYDLSEFSNKNYDTKAYLHKILAEGETDGIKLYSYVSGSDGWKEVPQFGPIPDIIPGTENTGTVQFKVVYDQSKDNKDEPISFNVQIK